jgi:glycosyltransferase involved in cell wall biosynthesis
MSDLPLVSIVTPSFNQARYLEATIQSVLAQEYPRLEYLVVDGGSTDGSVEIVKQYQNRLAYWVSEKDSGQADAINKGLRRAQGGIVAWLNSDDMYLPGAIRSVIEVFERNPEAGIVFGNVASIDEEGRTFNLQVFKPVTLPDLMAFYIISQPGVFMRRSVLEKAGHLDPSYHLLLDHHLWIRMARLAPLVYVPQTLAAARYHAEAKNMARAGGFGEEVFRILEWMRSDPAFAEEFLTHRRRIRAGAYRLNAYYLVEAGSNGQGLLAYMRAFLHHPMTVLKDWKRVVYAVFSLFGLRRVRDIYVRFRQRLHERGE